ncbi:hypothetical protein MNBD_BACTEROID05-1309 [hydrothermal vent metagenome]|uniref:Polymerase beta nucleotidyltransferase domain-containing protein n=1 Tax=hydrothermal vent metagenome TaxID=652676 RepID=A0A3B0TUE9_9ZZZZ
MMSVQKITLIREKVCKICDQFLGDDYILLVFGSLVRQEIVQSSDIDLAVYRQEMISFSLLVDIKEKLEEEAGTLRDIDVLNLTDKNINADLLRNILKEGEIWKEAKNSNALLKSLRKRLESLDKL